MYSQMIAQIDLINLQIQLLPTTSSSYHYPWMKYAFLSSLPYKLLGFSYIVSR